ELRAEMALQRGELATDRGQRSCRRPRRAGQAAGIGDLHKGRERRELVHLVQSFRFPQGNIPYMQILLKFGIIYDDIRDLQRRIVPAGLNPSELIELAALLVVVGALAGFLAGVFGIGGGAILVPVFYECFRLAGVPLEVRMPLCVGTSLPSSFRPRSGPGAPIMPAVRWTWRSCGNGR